MTNQIEPYSMIKKTNIKEHNDVINKINEIVDVINDTNLDTVNSKIASLEAHALKTDDDIAGIQAHNTKIDGDIAGIQAFP